MRKMILISESELKDLIFEAVNNVIDGVTKKIASTAAVRSYNNEIFRHRTPVVESTGGCGADDDDSGGCGSSPYSRRTTSYSSYGGCGGGYESGGC